MRRSPTREAALPVAGRAGAMAIGVIILAGCAAQRVHFTSEPSGAVVRVNGRRGTTPCCLQVPRDAEHVEVTLPSGETIRIELPPRPGPTQRAERSLRKAAGTTCEIVGAPLLLVAGLGLWLVSNDWDDRCGENTGYRDRRDEGDETEAVIAGAAVGGLLAGGMLFGAAEAVSPTDEPELLLPGDTLHLDLTDLQTGGDATEKPVENCRASTQ